MSFNLEFTGKHCIVKLLLQVAESMHTHAHMYVYIACKKIFLTIDSVVSQKIFRSPNPAVSV